MKAKRTNIIKKQGTKTLAGILAVGMTFGTPISVLADDNTSDSTMEQQAGVQNVLAKKVDGSETLVKVSEVVLGMIQRNEVKLDTDKFLKDVTTGQKVDPTTGERVTELGTPVEPSEPEIPTTPTEPSEPEIPETPAEPSEPEAPTTPSDPDEPETPADNIENTETDQNGQANQEEAVQTENTETASNEDLISRQQIVKLPQIIDDFRFWTVARTYAFAKDDLYVRESIPEGIDGTADTSDESLKADKKAAKKEAKKLNAIYEKAEQNKKAAIHAELITEQQQTEDDVTLNENVTDQNAEQVRYIGKLDKNGLLYILKEEENGWLYVESGNVRGFVKASEVYTSNAAQKLLEVYQKEAKKTAAENGTEYTGIEGTAAIAQTLVSPLENQAYTYLRATVNQTVADKNYATVNATMLNVREGKGTESRIVGTMNQGALCYVLADADSDWVYVESADVRGFVARQYLNTGDEVTTQVEITGEDHYQTAEEIISPEENQALYYTLMSTKEGTPNGAVRESILEYASQFIGNPYVWGGTSLTKGADCSGFVMSVYAHYGVSLPHSSSALRGVGRGVSYCATCDAMLYRGKTAAVIGYTEEAQRESEFLAELAEKVYYLPMGKEEVYLPESIEIIREKPLEITGQDLVEYLKTDAGEYKVDGVFILRDSVSAEQLIPGLEIEEGHVKVNLQMETNIPGCFAHRFPAHDALPAPAHDTVAYNSADRQNGALLMTHAAHRNSQPPAMLLFYHIWH